MGLDDWTTWGVLFATIAIMAFIMRRGRKLKRIGRPSEPPRSSLADAVLLSDVSSWGPGHHHHGGSDAGHHGGYFDGGGGDAGGGGHM